MTADTRSRRYQLTLNNPVEKGFTHDEIKKLINATLTLLESKLLVYV